jgi:hypothetical protein
LVCALALAPAAHGANEPVPDPVQHVQPDPAPVETAPAPPTQQQQQQQQPAAQQVLDQRVTVQPTRTSVTVTGVQQAPASKAHAASKTTSQKPARAKARVKRRTSAAVQTHRPHPATVEHPRIASAAAQRIATMLAFAAPRVSRRSDGDAELLAGAALLLLVLAAGSVLRLSTRMSDELFEGRPG